MPQPTLIMNLPSPAPKGMRRNHASIRNTLVALTGVALVSNWDLLSHALITPDCSSLLLQPEDSGGTDVSDAEVQSLFDGLCDTTTTSLERQNWTEPAASHECVLLNVAHADPNQKFVNCSPFVGGDNSLFGMKWCAWPPNVDRHISPAVLRSGVPSIEKGHMDAFRKALHNKTKGIVIDAGAQVGLFSAAALSAGHYTISIDARPEHVQMNLCRDISTISAVLNTV